MATASILLVDDETKILQALGSALRTEGYEVTTAPGGREAQRLLSQRQYDVLIVDNLMPDVTGIEVIRPRAGKEHRAGDGPRVRHGAAYQLLRRVPREAHPALRRVHRLRDREAEAVQVAAIRERRVPVEVDVEPRVVVRQRAGDDVHGRERHAAPDRARRLRERGAVFHGVRR